MMIDEIVFTEMDDVEGKTIVATLEINFSTKISRLEMLKDPTARERSIDALRKKIEKMVEGVKNATANPIC